MKIPAGCTLPGGNSRQFMCGNRAIMWFAWTDRHGEEHFSCHCEQHKDVKFPLVNITVFNLYEDAVAYQAMREL